MKTKHLLLVVVFFTLIQTNSFAQWVQVTDGLEDFKGSGSAIDACDTNTIVFATESIFLTSNGGVTWKNIILPFRPFDDISIVDSLHIWGSVSNGKIYSTSDGGENWNLQFYDTTLTKFMNYIEMFDLENGIAMGDAVNENGKALFLQTTDGGNTWISINDSAFVGGYSADTWRRLDFVNADIGYFLGVVNQQQKLYKTNNGGFQWEYANYERRAQIIKFYNKDIGLIKEGDSNGNYFQRTLDGSNTWESFALEVNGWGNDIEFLPNDPSKVWYVDGYGHHVLYSNDTGSTWTVQTMPDTNMIGRDIIFTDDNHGWILCDNGQLFYTNNNGGVITEVEKENPNILPTEYELKQNYPNPFNPSTVISYSLPTESIVKLQIFNTLGEMITTLVDEINNAGLHTLEWDASNLTSGVYLYRISAESISDSKKFNSVKKMLLIK